LKLYLNHEVKRVNVKEVLKVQNIKTGPPDDWEVKWHKRNAKWADSSTLLLHVMPNGTM